MASNHKITEICVPIQKKTDMFFGKNHKAELHERLRVCVCMQDTAVFGKYILLIGY